MKSYPRWTVTTLFVVALAASSVANASLVSRMNGAAVYDTDLNITWLADANYASTSNYAYNGLMTWSQANFWAAQLTVDGISGWRLPNTLQPDPSCSVQVNTSAGFQGEGAHCTGSEMGHLFYTELGGLSGVPITTTHNSFYNLFTNIPVNFPDYWSATNYAPDTRYAWIFGFDTGGQAIDGTGRYYLAWAVHPGDVAAVPVPAAASLFGSGLLGLIGVARRKTA